ncbi:MAG: hypothetical protein QOD86_1098 [Miltoncostaeaceae bacterium]|jgi:hypothetical protein|nr:hypothetical protein [Miltoncostaeaceae bacterium]
MSPAPGAGTPDRAVQLAAAVSALGQPEWAADAVRIAGREPRDAEGPTPSYRELARAGLELVEALAGEERWADAAGQARHLSRYFSDTRDQLHAVAGAAFDGLHAAVLARDPDEVEDFGELVREIFR